MNEDLLKTIALGVAGGLAGTLAMRAYWKTATAVAGEDPRGWTSDDAPHAFDEMGVAGVHHRAGESSTAAAGREAYEAVTGEEPSSETKTALSYTVHWLYGAAMGGLYGALRGPREHLDAPGGLVLGGALWALGDELLVPLLGLSKGATAYPPSQHANRLAAHLVYGLTTSATTQSGLALLQQRRQPTSWYGVAWDVGKTYLKWKAVSKAAARGWKALRG